MRNTLYKTISNGQEYYIRKVRKLWVGNRVSIKDYEWDIVRTSGLPLRIDVDNRSMTLTPDEVKEGRFSTGTYSESFAPFRSGYLINFSWDPDPIAQISLFTL